MRIYFAADHAGYSLKNTLRDFVEKELSLDAEDCGALSLDESDDYPGFVADAARKLSHDAEAGRDSRAIVIGASGQGEAMVANRFPHVRCALFYADPGKEQTDAGGKVLDIIRSTREHNNANALSLGARFLSEEEAKAVVKKWLTTGFSGEERHARRIAQIEDVSKHA